MLKKLESLCAGDFTAFGAGQGAAAQVLWLVVAREGGACGAQHGFITWLALPEQGDALAKYRMRVRERHKL